MSKTVPMSSSLYVCINDIVLATWETAWIAASQYGRTKG